MNRAAGTAGVSPQRRADWTRFLADLTSLAAAPAALEAHGRLYASPAWCSKPPACACRSARSAWCAWPGQPPVPAEVVGFSGDRAFLMPTGDVHGLSSGASVVPAPAWCRCRALGVPTHPWRRREDRALRLPLGDGLLGRVVDSHGQPLDRKGPLELVHDEPLLRRPINAMDRDPVREPLDTGVRAINALLTVGRGQRIGLFAGTGVGKSVLLGMMARYTAGRRDRGRADRRARPRGEGIHRGHPRRRGPARARWSSPRRPTRRRWCACRARATPPPSPSISATAGTHVLLLMDSLTRYAMAQREIALAIGEPPATKGYPPSCFAKLPQLVERSGNGCDGVRLDHRVLHRAVRGRRPAGSDRRRGARHPRRPHRAVARAGRGRPLSGHRRRALGIAGDEQRRARIPCAVGAALSPAARPPRQGPRPDPDRCLRPRPRCRARRRRSAAAADERSCCSRTCMRLPRSPKAWRRCRRSLPRPEPSNPYAPPEPRTSNR